MPTNRIEALEKFLQEDPNDPFNYYALALEYLKSDQQKAAALFRKLLDEHSDYLPTYYPYAHLMIELGKSNEAEALFNQGIEKAESAGDQKTVRELKAAYDDFLFDL